ncbi:RNA polymerase sigma factor [Paenibacillus peoriae]|uniref:RNA polymerase sigma factor n=1 Tax=Paenibacillus peoriae TaxID=59893 RepID=UPI00026C5887|nr:RNA polymerase sigma factor [Paenibacillus peoriae]MEC0182061.1 RNA polymerase sigma factor [Paenibacillus peoriae]
MLLIIISKSDKQEDIDFFTELYIKFYSIMKTKAYEITQDYTITDDLIQEAFIRLIKKIPILKSLNSCKRASYIIHTIRNTSFNYAKKCSNEKNKCTYGLLDEGAEYIADSQLSIEEKYNLKEEYEQLGNVIGLLSERDQLLLINKYILELTDTELSKVIDVPVANIRSYLTRARRRALKLFLQSEENEDHDSSFRE